MSFGDPEKVAMNDRTDRERPQVRKEYHWPCIEVLTSRANHSGGGPDSLLPCEMATNVRRSCKETGRSREATRAAEGRKEL